MEKMSSLTVFIGTSNSPAAMPTFTTESASMNSRKLMTRALFSVPYERHSMSWNDRFSISSFRASRSCSMMERARDSRFWSAASSEMPRVTEFVKR